MDKILKESYIYKIIMFFKNLFSKLFRESFIIQGFLKNNYNEKNTENSLMVRLLEWFLKHIRIIAHKLKLDKIFANSMFSKPLIWTTITIALTPIIPTMMVLVLALASLLSLILMAAITPKFKFKHYKINTWIFFFTITIAVSACISISMAESIKIAMLMISFVIFYFVIINTITTKKQLMMILNVLIVIATLTAV